MSIPRPEYPRPQFVRPDWLCLNGTWEFEIDHGNSGDARGLLHRPLQGRITVPFCPESMLSGIGNTDFMAAVWYRREIAVPAAWKGRQIHLHFQAVDYDATIWAVQDGKAVELRRHRGGFTPITCDLTGVATPGKSITIVVRARDDHRQVKPRGKQSAQYASMGCMYTRTTGIWQSVWLEPVPEVHLRRPRITPDVAGSAFWLEQPISQNRPGLKLRVTVRDGKEIVCRAETPADVDLAPRLHLSIPPAQRKLWSPGNPHLYDLQIQLVDAAGATVDQADSYAGLRSVAISGKAVLLNGQPVFQRLVLDQGFYPDGIYTAPNDEALRRDIELSMAVGFNGARLHQKVFEERFLFHADRMGYLVWGEFADWGCSGAGPGHDHQQPTATYITQWLEVLQRDYSHPSIIGWCPLNETLQNIHDNITVLDDVTRGMFLAAKAMDSSRPVLDVSGYSHRVPETDIYDSHDYTQDVAEFAALHTRMAEGLPFVNVPDAHNRWSLPYRGQPYMVSEFGGTWWNPLAKEGEASWGYGDRPKTLDEFYKRFEGLCATLLDNPHMFGYCYTQLTDVFQEQNGIFLFDRGSKFDLTRLHAIQARTAAIEARK